MEKIMQQRLAPVAGPKTVYARSVKPYHQFIRLMRNHFTRPVTQTKPYGMTLPDRVWDRQSALLMSLYESRHYE
ncbi:MAG: hypothetical protein P8171_00280 [Candidatus Thiodiazotropha sp.]|jgi:hypothetical protein